MLSITLEEAPPIAPQPAPAAAKPPASKTEPFKITELEGLRGALAWWVVLSHLLNFSGYFEKDLHGPLRMLAKGSEAVDGFVILSGFVIFLLLDQTRQRFGPFLFRRALRLFPAFAICFTTAIIIAPAAVSLLERLPWRSLDGIQTLVEHWQLSRAHTWPHVAAHATLLHGLLPDEVLPNSVGAFLAPAWSISLEWQFYLVAPFVLLLIRRGGWPLVLLCGAVVITAFARPLFGSHSAHGLIGTWPLPAFLPMKARFFFVGIASYYVYKSLRNAPAVRGAMTTLFVVALSLAAMFSKSPALLIWTAVFGAFLCRFSRSESLVSRSISAPLNWAPVQWVGRISYSTYLCHEPLIYGGVALLLATGTAWTRPLFFGALFLVVAPVTLLCSHLLYRFVEAPFIRASKRWSAHWA